MPSTKLKPLYVEHDVLHADDGLEQGAPFCSNPDCALHIRLTDLPSPGGASWVRLADGRIFGRTRLGGLMLCDACGTQRGPVRLPQSRQRTLD